MVPFGLPWIHDVNGIGDDAGLVSVEQPAHV